ncbi:MAG: hypothetical protein WA177_06255 [Xanthobacteraceae bacterium]
MHDSLFHPAMLSGGLLESAFGLFNVLFDLCELLIQREQDVRALFELSLLCLK